MHLVSGDLRGRDEDIQEVLELLEQGTRLITLVGMGGVGKTVLARQVLHHAVGAAAAQKAWFDFEAERSGEETLKHLSAGVRQLIAENPDGSPDGPLLIAVDTSPTGPDPTGLIRSLLEDHPGLQILATRRGRFRLSLERQVTVKPLALPEAAPPADKRELEEFVHNNSAVALFVERVLALTPETTLDRNTVTGMLAICRRLGGVPLALQMAALKSSVLTPDALLAELDLTLGILEDLEPGIPARHRSMIACLAPSIRHLSPPEQAVLAAVAEFEGGCSLQTLRTLELGSHPSGEPVQLLSAAAMLVEQQLLQTVPARSGSSRFQVMPLIRDYLMTTKEISLGSAERQGLARVLVEQSRAMAAVRGPEADHARTWFDEEYANLTQVLNWLIEAKEMSQAAELVQALYLYWLHRGLIEEGLATVEQLRAAGGLDARGQAQVLGTAGGLRAHLTSYTSAHDELQKAVTLWRSVGSLPDLAGSLVAFSAAALEVDGFRSAEAALTEAMELYTRLGDGWAHARALALLGAAAATDPQRAELARTCLEAASADLLSFGDQVAASLPMEQIGRLLIDDGDYDQAHMVLNHGLTESRSVGDQVQTSSLLNLLALVDTLTNRPAFAAAGYFESLQIAVRLGLKARAVWCLEGLAESFGSLNEHTLASTAAASAAIIRGDLGLEYWVEFCCPRRPSTPAPKPTTRATRLAALGGSAWPPQQILAQAPQRLLDLMEPPTPAACPRAPEKSPDGLTRREIEILGLVASGFTNRDIAANLVISIDTVGRHISNLYRKIGARGRADATAYAWRMNLVAGN
ncbi:putative ATPase/DNA-binding CsgD family transcriptional regulator [Arthrobacter globiformis]|uniref:LuxR C-terminal-related transcriptional regulator n=1 Tax=Arthrobacter globiformis TaxID=1665 RepID=UPI002782B22F|nr:LuxR C-terminal-related transcriptional regulator [Arthrobacter globiformis]MDQ1060834.1 putative ATPase/DNA-binding CsgD family transcriptional regulator [Arthrobacter globiformis]